MNSLDKILVHEPINPYKDAATKTERCDLCKLPLETRFHGTPVRDDLHLLQLKWFEADRQKSQEIAKLAAEGAEINPESLRAAHTASLVDVLMQFIFAPEERLHHEINTLNMINAELQNNMVRLQEMKKQARAQRLAVPNKPSGLIVPGS